VSLFLKRVMRRLGVYFRHLSPQEQHYLRSHPNRELREFFIEQALLGPLSLGQISATEANFLNRLVREQAGEAPYRNRDAVRFLHASHLERQAGTPEISHCRQLLLEHVRPGP
jgi:hypothetical protein